MSRVLEVGRSLVNRRCWHLRLSCGCIAYLAAPRRPTRETHPCPLHPVVRGVQRSAGCPSP